MCVVTFAWEENNAVEKVKKFNKSKSLVWAVLEVTNTCNLNCKWCYASSNISHKPEFMGIKEVDRLLKVLADSGLIQVTFSGGEPTLYPKIVDAVKKASDYGMIVHMNTNGYVLNSKFAKELFKVGLSQVQINIDSIDPEKHDMIRGRKNSFKRAVQALKAAVETGITAVSQTVITKENENEVFEIFKLARSIGVQRCRVWDMMPVGCGKDVFDIKPHDFIDILKKLDKFVYESGGKSVESGDPLFPGDYKTKLDVFGGFCAAIRGGFTVISVKGDMYMCATQRKPLFNIFDFINKNGTAPKDFYRVKLKEYIQSIKIPSECSDCIFSEKCRGGCPTRREYNDWGRDYWCRAE